MEATQHKTQINTSDVTEEQYNYEHFRPGILMKDMKLTRRPAGPRPGDMAPDFELKDTEGRTWRLNELRGQPVVLIIGSASCPMTQGGLPGLKELRREYGEQVHWLSLYVREAHPGEHLQPHHSYEQKRQQASVLHREEGAHWPVLVDGLTGTTHINYGLLPNPVFLIDAEGA